MGDSSSLRSETTPTGAHEVLYDSITVFLFLAFVIFLFIGYLGLWPGVPSSELAIVFLLGSLVVLFWANLSADRATRRSAVA